jgi:hypothetical protein
VFAHGGGEDNLLLLTALHEGHSTDIDAAAAEEAKDGLSLYSHGSWQHRCFRITPILHHLRNAAIVLARQAENTKEKMESYLGKGNARRERIQVSLEILHGILEDPSRPPPELFEAADAELLADQAQGHGATAVTTLLRIYRDEEVQRFSLGALARLLADGTKTSVPAVANLGGCELVTLALQRYGHNAHLVAEGARCLSLMATHAETSRRLARCEGASALVGALRGTSSHGNYHREAQRWGLGAVAVLARNGQHKGTMFAEGVCDLLPGLLFNHADVVADVEVQLWGLHAVLELCTDSVDTAGEALLDAGLLAAMRKVRKGPVGSEPEWKDLAAMVFDDLGWEQ